MKSVNSNTTYIYVWYVLYLRAGVYVCIKREEERGNDKYDSKGLKL